jgi:NADPH2:quinone reductase
MRAVGVNRFGGPEALEVVELPEPHAGPGQLRIRVHAAAVNPTDTYVRNGDRAKAQQKDPPPYVPGMDAAGVLDEIGEGVDTDLRVGDPVMAIVLPDGSHGAYSEYVAVPAGSVARAPAGASHAEACTLPMNGLTARLSLDELALSSGGTILVSGAAGAYGGYVVQLAKADGLRVIADAAPADEALVAELGADVVLPRGDDLADRVRELHPDGVDGVADGAVLNELLVPAVRDGGGFASVRGWKGEPQRDIRFHATFVRRYLTEQARLDRLREQAERGEVTLRVARTFPAAQAGEAHRLLEGGGIRGRLVVEF